MIKRDYILNKLMIRRHNNMIKVVTGLRRCGKSYLLFELFANALMAEGVRDDHIIKINLEDRRRKNLRDPDNLLQFIDGRMVDDQMYYILLDEVQHVKDFEDVLNSYLHIHNADVYVTGSNAKFLSKDVITEFRGRGDEIHIHPLSFSEFVGIEQKKVLSKEEQLAEYLTYGGLPQVALMKSAGEKRTFLRALFTHTYLKDIKERYNIKLDEDLEELVHILASSIGGLTNPRKLANTFKSVKNSDITQDTIKNYLDYLQDAFVVEKSMRYDIKGKRYIDTPAKYYFEDLGLRNALLNFRQMEETNLMENLIYSELRRRGMDVDVGEVSEMVKKSDGGSERRHLEVDFVCNQGFRRYYIQSAYSVDGDEKREQELLSLRKINDSFRKVVVTWNSTLRYQNDDGIMFVGLYDFLTNPNSFLE
ncbi:MAG: ATP-binding protein [Bacteroidales bacterium]|nr:ATP-binding protein [Bacteroidales bacterium]